MCVLRSPNKIMDQEILQYHHGYVQDRYERFSITSVATLLKIFHHFELNFFSSELRINIRVTITKIRSVNFINRTKA